MRRWREDQCRRFDPSRSGDALLRAEYALPENALKAVAITQKPEAGSPPPPSTPTLVGASAESR